MYTLARLIMGLFVESCFWYAFIVILEIKEGENSSDFRDLFSCIGLVNIYSCPYVMLTMLYEMYTVLKCIHVTQY